MKTTQENAKFLINLHVPFSDESREAMRWIYFQPSEDEKKEFKSKVLELLKSNDVEMSTETYRFIEATITEFIKDKTAVT